MAAIGIDLGVRRAAWTVGLCFCAAMAEGYDIQSMGVAAPSLAPALALTRDQLGPVFSASTLGLLMGSLVIGPVADRVGRRWCLIASLAMFGVFSAATALAWSLPSLLTIRVLAGLGLGGAMPNLIALTAETTNEDQRARMVTLMSAGYPFGAASASAVAAMGSWKGVFIVGGLVPLTLAAAMIVLLPESQRFLAARKAAAPEERRDGFGAILFGSDRALTTPLLWTAFFAALLLLYLLLNWLPTLMVDRGAARSAASLVSLLFNLGGGVGVLVLSTMLDGARRLRTLGAVFAGLAAALVALALVSVDLATAGAVGFLLGMFASFPPLALYGLAAGYYGVVMRGAGVGAAVAAGRLGAVVGPLAAAALLGVGLGGAGLLLALLPLVALTAAATLALLGRPTVAD